MRHAVTCPMPCRLGQTQSRRNEVGIKTEGGGAEARPPDICIEGGITGGGCQAQGGAGCIVMAYIVMAEAAKLTAGGRPS